MVKSVVALSIVFIVLVLWLVASVVFHLAAGIVHLVAAAVGLLFLVLLGFVVWIVYQGNRMLE